MNDMRDHVESFAKRLRPSDLPRMVEPGLYAIFARSGDVLPGIEIPPSQVVYIGQSHDLSQRNHFAMKHSGFSSPRRSFGAILKDRLGLVAAPRSPGSSASNYRSFRFEDDGEYRLTDWMFNNLECSIQALAGDLDILEKDEIRSWEPPLNLNTWKNPQRAKIFDLRRICRDQAKVKWARAHR